jgi:hypothetical protein
MHKLRIGVAVGVVQFEGVRAEFTWRITARVTAKATIQRLSRLRNCSLRYVYNDSTSIRVVIFLCSALQAMSRCHGGQAGFAAAPMHAIGRAGSKLLLTARLKPG